MMVSFGLALTLFATHSQGDLLDGDPNIHGIDYVNADVNEVLRTLFRHIYANYAVESGIEGNINLHLVNTAFSVVLKKTLDQVYASSNFERSMYIVEKSPAHPSAYEVLARKLPPHDFRKTTVREALQRVFEDANIGYRFPMIETKLVGLKFAAGTLSQDLQILLPIAKCKANYRHGRFELLPVSEELPLKVVLDKHVHGIDFVNVNAKDAFSTFFHQIGVEYVLGPNIDNRFTLMLRDARFEDALDALCQLTDTTYQLRGTVFKIERRRFQ